jgi:hypothetical protein
MTIRNRELSQFGSFISIDDASQKISITNGPVPYVGIGTTNPSEKLQVAGNVKIDGDLIVDGTFGFDFDNFSLEGDANINITGIVTASSFVNDEGVLTVTDRWEKTGNDIYRLLGNVGVGLSNPSERLSVLGNVSASRFISTIADGTAPFQVTSTTEVTNLNASLLRGGVPGQNINANDIITLGATQTLTNKTLTNPLFGSAGVRFSGTTGTTTLRANATAAGSLILPTTNGTLVSTGDTGVVTSNMIADLNITNVDIASNAAISYSKLNLTNSIVNADIVNGTIQNAKLTNSTISGISLGSNLFTLTRGTYLTGSNYNGSAATTWAVDATSVAPYADKVVARDASGNFSANTITLANNLTANSGTVTGQTLSVGSGGLSVSGTAFINNSTTSTSTTTGALRVSGGVGIVQNTYIGGLLNVASTSQLANTTVSGITSITNTSNATSTTTGALRVSGGVGIGSSVYIGGITSITNTSNATSTTTGALRVSGGVGIGSSVYIGGITSITNTSNATSTTTGALRVSGGVGIGSSVYIGGDLIVNGNIISQSIGEQIIILEDRKSAGTNGGNASAGSWINRTLNTEVFNNISGSTVSITNGTVTLSPGTYHINASAPAFGINGHQCRFTGGSITIYGSSEFSFQTGGAVKDTINTRSMIDSVFTISTNTTFNLQHRIETSPTPTNRTDVLGSATGFTGTTEVYSQVSIRKIA